MTTNTTTPATGATITEKELFAEYANGSVTYGPKRRPYTTEVRNLFSGFGETDRFMDAMEDAFADILEDDDPTYALEMLVMTLEGMASDVKAAARGFQELKVNRWIEVEDDEPQHYSAAAQEAA